MVDWNEVLGEHNIEINKRQAQAAYDEMLSAGVSEVLAVETLKQVYGKSHLVSGERELLVKQAIAAVTLPTERAVLEDFEKRIVPTFTVDSSFDHSGDPVVPDKKPSP